MFIQRYILENLDINSYKVGMKEIDVKKISSSDVERISLLTGDDNPIHLNEDYAKNSKFGRRIVHGMLVASMFLKIFGTKFPGNGCVYVSQDIKFIRPVYLGDEVRAEVLIESVDFQKNIIKFLTFATVNGIVVVESFAKILISRSIK